MKPLPTPQISLPLMATNNQDVQRARAGALHLHGLLAHWEEVINESWVTTLLGWEEQERARRSLERRLGTARIGRLTDLRLRLELAHKMRPCRHRGIDDDGLSR